jgi:putative flippase GtrA
MQIKDIIDRFDSTHKLKICEVARFVLVGIIATIIQFVTYRICLLYMNPTAANTVGYVVSFVFNFYASTKYTFKVKSDAKTWTRIRFFPCNQLSDADRTAQSLYMDGS